MTPSPASEPPDPGDDAQDSPVERALAEPIEEDYVGTRDLTSWPSGAGQQIARAAIAIGQWMAPHRVLLLTLVAGLAVVGALAYLAAEVYDAVVEADGVAGLDRPVLDAMIAIRTSTADASITAYTNVGGTLGVIIVATATAVALSIAWRRWTPVVLIAATMLGSALLTTLGKRAVGRARPPLTDAVPPYETSFSFPSGHSLNAVALAGVVSYLVVRHLRSPLARVIAIAGAVAYAVTMGLSRVYLGHHWLTDVLVAWALGLAWVVAVVTAHRLFLTVRRGRSGVSRKGGRD